MTAIKGLGETRVIFPLSRFQAHKSFIRGDWYVYDSATERTSRDVDGSVRHMSMSDALHTADWLNQSADDGRIK